MSLYDPSVFMKSALAVDAVYTDANGGESDIRVIFSTPYSQSQMGGGQGFQNTNPSALADLADVPDAASNINQETLEVDEVVYSIIAVEPQDDGNMVRLILSTDPIDAA